MVQIDFQRREVAIKLVYYGPALSGKTTNLQVLHERVDPNARGRLLTLDTKDDRTLFFDLLPITWVRLAERYELGDRFGVSRTDFLDTLARQLSATAAELEGGGLS